MNSPSPPAHEASGHDEGLPPISPDFVEQLGLDEIVPGPGYQLTPMVGLGGSAGSIQALSAFFKAMPPDSGMAFVVVLHLSPTHSSTMADLLGRSTAMTVLQAEDGQKVEPNHVYVIPPGKYLAAVDGHLQLSELESDRGKRVAVDLFFRSLADTHGSRAAAVVLSGADGDGALGIKRVKERGGLTIAQDPDEAEYPSMPRTSIETGMVDWVLEVAEMPKRLLEYRQNEERIKLPPEQGPPLVRPKQVTVDEGEAALRDVLAFLRTRTGRDFSYYKRATILRRIARRMQVNSIDSLPEYLGFLRTHPGEAGALLQDLLISVTNFFRDRDAFLAVEQHIPELFAGKTQSDSVRIWVPACATGEEAYSFAMLLSEYAHRFESPPALQVFAGDIDDQAIQTARAGHYPETIAADVSEDRLRRFFVKDHNGYRVRRELREMVLFATHDLLKDAPFSRMDLISCRNLLIYLNRDAQQRALETFHFAAKPGGKLFLGSSEAVDDNSRLFGVLDKKNRIYVQQAAVRTGLPIPARPSTPLGALGAHDHAGPVVHGKRFVQDAAVAFHGPLGLNLDRAALVDLHYRLLERFDAPSVIVNSDYDIVHLSEHAGQFLQIVGGEPTMNLVRVVKPDLRVELRAALFRAMESNLPVETIEIPSEIDGERCAVEMRVSPAQEVAPGFLLVVFKKHTGAEAALPDSDAGTSREPVVGHLERELEQLKGDLRNTVEQYEASTEELKASNEELQAMNEELRSATEELETSREELQSINEELNTVNQEMKGKMEEVARANSDLQNLMESTSIATVFLNRSLEITRYTPTAAEIFHMIPGDIGRPLAHLKHDLQYPDLMEDIGNVLRTLVPIEREVRDDGHHFLARIQPYRTLEDHIAGAILTLVDVTDRTRANEALRESEERMRILIESANDFAIFTTDRERTVDSWNGGAERVFGYTEREIVGQSADILFTPEDRAKGDAEHEMQLARDEGRAGNERWHARKDGSLFFGSGSVMPLRDQKGSLRGFVKIMRDLTIRKRTQEALDDHVDELTRFNKAAVGRETRMIELKREINKFCLRLGEAPRYELEADHEDAASRES
jgi:two-component system, chemotaxis family, CheB/CheR fusion protein